MNMFFKVINRHFAVLCTFFLASAITIFSVSYVYKMNKHIALNQLDNTASMNTERLSELVNRDLNSIGAGANFYHSTEPSDWHQFVTFSKTLLSYSDSLIGLQWMEKVAVNDIPDHIEKVRKTFPSYQIYTVPKDEGRVEGYVLKGDKPIYIATDIFPRTEANINILGFYSSRERFDRIVEHIFTHGKPDLSDKIRLLQDSLDQKAPKDGMLVYYPVFDTYEQNLLGVMIGVIRLSQYFDKLVNDINKDNHLSIQILDTGFDAEDDPILFQSPDWENNEGDVIEKFVHLSNRNWMVKFKKKVEISESNELALVSMIGAGITITLLLTFIVSLVTREKVRLGIILDEKTRELRFLVEHDTLTGLHNRRAFNDRLAQLLTAKKGFSLLSFDIDKFKLINDIHGHPAGDAILQHVSYVVSQCLQHDDMFTRIGGDEFCIFTYITDSKTLQDYCDAICQCVDHSDYKMNGKILHCTISIGACVWQGESAEELQYHADLALYESKDMGRNTATVVNR